MRNTLLILASVLLAAGGQLLLKKGMTGFGAIGGRAIWGMLFQVLCQPAILAGLAAFVVSSVLWLAVLSRNDLSYAYPMVSVSYIAVIIGSRVLFGERIDAWKVLGILLICLGVTSMAQTRSTGARPHAVCQTASASHPERMDSQR